jgi:glycosyltransferase involved in cell wall biosynthesis
MNPTISILIPTYNAAEVVSNCIESALSLPYQDIEIIVGNDGSTDHTQEVINKYSDERLRRYSNEENLGHDKNVLKIAEMASGDYIFFTSDEDLIHPTGFERIYQLATNPIDTSVIFGNILDAREGDADYYYKRDEEFWLTPDKAIRAFASDLQGTPGWWGHSYITGTVIKAENIDFPFLQDYIGCGYMASALAANALLQGGLYWINDPVAIITPARADRVPKTKSNNEMISSYSTEARYEQIKYRLQFAEDCNLNEELYEFIRAKEKQYTVGVLFKKYGYDLISILDELDQTILDKEEFIKLSGGMWLRAQINKPRRALDIIS